MPAERTWILRIQRRDANSRAAKIYVSWRLFLVVVQRAVRDVGFRLDAGPPDGLSPPLLYFNFFFAVFFAAFFCRPSS